MTYKISSKSDYLSSYKLAQQDPDKFWSKIAEEFHWFKKWDKISDCDFEKGEFSWFEGSQTNISYNCLDRIIERGDGDKIAIIHEANDPSHPSQKITYSELHEKVCRFSNFLLAQNIKKGDRVCIYMPMVIEASVAMLACLRIGAVHSVVFAGFSAKALSSRIENCGAKTLITSDLLYRGDKVLKLIDVVKDSLKNCQIENLLIHKRGEGDLSQDFSSQISLKIIQDEIDKFDSNHEAQKVEAEDLSFILYTSGSTGKPKGIYHSSAGYMVYAGYSFQNVFNYKDQDIFFCSADIGWITGHSYLIYGPLLNGATTLMFEGVPTYPDASRFWKIIEKHKVNIFYTAPTAIRALMQKGDEFVEGHDLSSLKTLGTVGEPINEEAWNWYYKKIGNKKCSIVDSWWQTETGGIMISSLAQIIESKPSFAGYPLPGIVPILIDEQGEEIKEPNKIGKLHIKNPWPSMLRGVYNNKEKFLKTYLSESKGKYFAGDGAFFDKDGLFRIIGRIDDVINVSGHRLGTAEIENAINSHKNISESAVIGCPHDIKGECIYAFIILKGDSKIGDEELKNETIEIIKSEIGSIAKPERIIISKDLPKTRSGKIMRRILKKLVRKEDDLGDVSTLVNPEVVDKLKEQLW